MGKSTGTERKGVTPGVGEGNEEELSNAQGFLLVDPMFGNQTETVFA